MNIHHLNLGSFREIDPTYDSLSPAPAVCHAFLVETPTSGLVLVESGLGSLDVERPAEALDAEWLQMTEAVLAPGETAVRQVARLGFDPADVRHIVLTHLDVDHSGGLPDFPAAKVHVFEAERRAAYAEGPSRRYRPLHWAHGPDWAVYGEGGERWFGLEGVRELEGLPPEILLVPLGGHTAGHAGVAVRDRDRWLLHAGDAYFYHRELDPQDHHGHPLLDILQNDSQVDEKERLGTHDRLRALVRDHADEVEVVSAHDPWEFARYVSTQRVPL
jgi:glyoxylase-like metal-dependent hydrolase (beta-lactamase superfamily II)